MYGVERSVVALTRLVGSVDGMTMLDDNGSVGVNGVGTVVLRPGVVGMLALLGRSHEVYAMLAGSTEGNG
jgi:hypothetical protein